MIAKFDYTWVLVLLGFIAVIAYFSIFIYLCEKVAKRKGRDSGSWGVLGFFFSFIALLILYLLPPKNVDEHGDVLKRCPYCTEMIKADAIKCRYCGSMLNHSE